MAYSRTGTVKLPLDLADKLLRDIQRSPGVRRKARTILQREGNVIKQIAEEIAEHDLNRRPANRRTTSGPEYHDSFVVKVEDGPLLESLMVRVGNNHKWAGAVEYGVKPHVIRERSKGSMTFPWIRANSQSPVVRSSTRGGVGRKGQWPLAYGSGPNYKPADGFVDHPGAPAFRVLRRAMERYRDRRSRALGIPRA